MFLASSAVLALAVASVSAHSINHVRRHHAPRAQPTGWASGYLEDYSVYHDRYLAIKCEDKHNTTFFDMCCHPMLATETLEKNRAPCCAPGTTAQCPSSSSSAAAPASTLTDDDDCGDDGDDAPTAGSVGDDDDDCDDEDGGEDASSTVISTKGASSTPTAAAGDDDDEDCEEDGDDNSSAAQRTKTVDHAIKAATSTHAVVSLASTHSSSEPAPTTTHTTDKTTTTVKASPTSTASTSSPSGDMISGGFGTWFTQNGVAGACGTVHKDSDFVFALPNEAYANGANCGRKMRVYDASDPQTFVDGLVADECPTCDNSKCVDMSVAAFQVLASLSTGELKITYQFLQN